MAMSNIKARMQSHFSSFLYPHSIHLLTPANLGRLTLSRAHLQSLVIPALGTKLIQVPLLFTAVHGALLTTTFPRVECLLNGSIIAVQRVSVEVGGVHFLGESKGSVLGVDPTGSYRATSLAGQSSTPCDCAT